MENVGGGSSECTMCTIKHAFIRTAETERDKNQESLEKTCCRTTTHQLKTSFTHHSEPSTAGGKGFDLARGFWWRRGSSTEQGESCLCYRLVSAAKVPCLSTFPVFSRLAVAAATPTSLKSSGVGSAGPVRSGVEGFGGAEKDRLFATLESLRTDIDVRSALVSCN